jgi:glycosyltransferase involved in cell wall biosynthesis
VKIINFNYASRYDIRLFFSLRKAIQRINPDIIHTHLPVANIYTRFACLFNRKIIVSTQHSAQYINNFYHAVDRMTAKRNTLYIANSNFTSQYLIDHHYSNIHNTCIIPLCIKVPETIPSLSEIEIQDLNIPKDARIIGMIGSFKIQKGHIHLIDALEEVVKTFPNCVLLLLGEGDTIKSIKDKVIGLGLSQNVRFLGLKSNVYSYLQRMEVCVFPSLTESFGLAILEAMSQKVPVIAFNVDAIPELIENRTTGLLVPKGDTKALADSIIELLLNESMRTFLAKNAYHQHRQSFNYSKLVHETEETYLELVNRTS